MSVEELESIVSGLPTRLRLRGCALLITAGTLFGGGCDSRECSNHGSLRVGELVPSLAGVTDTGAPFHTREPWTNLTVYAIADTHPPLRIDTGKTVPSIRAQKLGARLVRSGDGKVAQQFGMSVVAGKPLRYDTKIVVLCDTNCRILRIWKPAGVDDLDDLLSPIEIR